MLIDPSHVVHGVLAAVNAPNEFQLPAADLSLSQAGGPVGVITGLTSVITTSIRRAQGKGLLVLAILVALLAAITVAATAYFLVSVVKTYVDLCGSWFLLASGAWHHIEGQITSKDATQPEPAHAAPGSDEPTGDSDGQA